MRTEKRKLEHLNICLGRNVGFKSKTTLLEDLGFGGVELGYNALPKVAKGNIDLSCAFLGKAFKAPLMVEAITGGTEKAGKINRDIAIACEGLGIGMGLGSQRAMLENPELAETYCVRDVAPSIFLAGNIGVVNLGEYSISELREALDTVGADALAIHINAAHEAVQEEGNPDFSNAIENIKKIASKLGKPVYVKEVGHGINFEVAKALGRTGIKAIDVAGAGGTSWTGVEAVRAKKEIANELWDIGLPTAASILEVKKAFRGEIIASGGIRNGFQIAKSIVLGADVCGIALPVLRAQSSAGAEGAKKYLEKIIEEIRVACFLIDAKNITELKKKDYVLHGKLREWAEQRKMH